MSAPAPAVATPPILPASAAGPSGRENQEAITGSAGSHSDEGSGVANRGAVIGIVVAVLVVLILAIVILIIFARRDKGKTRSGGGKFQRDGPSNRLFDAENGTSDFTQANGSHMEMATTGWANEGNGRDRGIGMQMYSLPEESEERGTPNSTAGPIQPHDWAASNAAAAADSSRRQAMPSPAMTSPFAAASGQASGQSASSRPVEVVGGAPQRLPKIPGRKKGTGTRIVSDEF